MKKTALLLSGFALLGVILIQGCATPTLPTLTQPFRAWVKAWEIEVVSDPGGADAYINGMFIGKTPAVTQWRVYYNTLGIPEEQPPKVIVVKQGYQTEGMTPDLLNPRGGSERITVKFTLAEEGSSHRGYVGTVKPPEYVGSVQNVRIDADLTEGIAPVVRKVNERDWQTDKSELNDKTLKEIVNSPLQMKVGRQEVALGKREGTLKESKETELKKEDLYDIVKNIKTFEYEGGVYGLVTGGKKYFRGNSIVFSGNLDKKEECLPVLLADGKYVQMNLEIFTADLSDGKLINVKRLTKTKDKNETAPFWTNEGNIAYLELNMKDAGVVTRGANVHVDMDLKDSNSKCYVMDPSGRIIKEISNKEYFALRDQD